MGNCVSNVKSQIVSPSKEKRKFKKARIITTVSSTDKRDASIEKGDDAFRNKPSPDDIDETEKISETLTSRSEHLELLDEEYESNVDESNGEAVADESNSDGSIEEDPLNANEKPVNKPLTIQTDLNRSDNHLIIQACVNTFGSFRESGLDGSIDYDTPTIACDNEKIHVERSLSEMGLVSQTYSRSILQLSITKPQVLVGWEVYVEKLGVGYITRCHKIKFFSTKFEIEFQNGRRSI